RPAGGGGICQQIPGLARRRSGERIRRHQGMEKSVLMRPVGGTRNRVALCVVAVLFAACAAQPRPDGMEAATAGGATTSTPVTTRGGSPVLDARGAAVEAPKSRTAAGPALDATTLPPFEGRREELAATSTLPRVDRTAPKSDVWQRIRDGFAMPD